ncbi:hypothetical protein F1F79_02450 [Listeria monocytogenes]|uniref:hypothetical protein n=1 Tax=Listeria monocytogenes TaxID=1639 RepID=UPI0004D42493|nr:hypothetical protein [Listeria monocytogenes]EAC3172719.1 hypothetical protein [Listeria monocytogenes]EAC7981568.1 hypothetical protein [Listeria monocytogenes]EAD1582463.1 hypothetical protein [Listeria monocytogenes]EAD2068765.1 hypothetical protein [Listeria monocytogenes]EAD2074962.1 hypothetical protein [Listeria monocytogenes]
MLIDKNNDEEASNEIITSLLLKKHINSYQLSMFLKESGLNSYGNKNINEKLRYVSNEIKNGNISLEDFELFLANQAKYTNNRIVITVPVNINANSPLTSYSQAREALGSDNLNFNKLIGLGDDLPVSSEYILVAQELTPDSDNVFCFSQCYLKVSEIKIIDTDDTLRYEKVFEFIWIDVFPKQSVYNIHMCLPPSGKNGRIESSLSAIYSFFSKEIEPKWMLTPSNHSAQNTLYKMYKVLTEHAEKPYTEKIEPYYSQIEEFVNQIGKNIGYDDSGIQSIELKERTKKLFERAIIQQDYNFFRTNVSDNREGVIDKFQYRDRTGASVQASADTEISMDEHDIYFDTKETIALNKQLNTLWLRWYDRLSHPKEEISQIGVKYECYRNFYVTHFLREHVSKERCDYVLPKFITFESLSI